MCNFLLHNTHILAARDNRKRACYLWLRLEERHAVRRARREQQAVGRLFAETVGPPQPHVGALQTKRRPPSSIFFPHARKYARTHTALTRRAKVYLATPWRMFAGKATRESSSGKSSVIWAKVGWRASTSASTCSDHDELPASATEKKKEKRSNLFGAQMARPAAEDFPFAFGGFHVWQQKIVQVCYYIFKNICWQDFYWNIFPFNILVFFFQKLFWSHIYVFFYFNGKHCLTFYPKMSVFCFFSPNVFFVVKSFVVFLLPIFVQFW